MAQSLLSTTGGLSLKPSVSYASRSPLANRSASAQSPLLALPDHAARDHDVDVGHLR